MNEQSEVEQGSGVVVPNGATYAKLPWLHIRGQFSYHCEAYIVGSRVGLTALRDAISAALADGDGEATAIANDGEGYAVTVRRTSRLRDMGAPPYIDELAREIAEIERNYLRKAQRHNWCLYQRIKEARDIHPNQGEQSR